ncbi:retrovirus-related pol polyprotein LINE-1 [Tanacetum coccineum]
MLEGVSFARNGVGVNLAAGLKDKVVQVTRRGDRIMAISSVIDGETVNMVSAYAPQVGLSDAIKKSFWDALDELVREAFPSEACSSQHRLVTLDVLFERQRQRRAGTKRPRILWKNLNGDAVETFRAIVSKKLSTLGEDLSASDADQMESWWFGEEVQTKIAAKQARFRELLLCHEGNQEDRAMAKERYKVAKREAKIAVAQAKDKAYEDLYKKLDSKEGANDIYRIAKARERKRRDLGNIRYIKDEEGRTIVIEEDIRKRWGEYFSSLFNERRPEGSVEVENSSQPLQFDCYYSRINQGEVRAALQKMGRNKAVGPDQIPIEAWRVIERRLRRETRVSENQFGFMPGRSTTEAFHLLRNLMEKYRERQRDLHMTFLDLEKAYDNVPREFIWRTLIDKGTPRRYLRVIKDDIVLVAESADGLNMRLKSWRRALEDNGLRVSRDKTEYLRCDFGRYEAAHGEEDIIRIGDQMLQPKESFRYMGSVIHRSGRIDEDITHCIRTGWMRWRAASGVLCDKRVPIFKSKPTYKPISNSNLNPTPN